MGRLRGVPPDPEGRRASPTIKHGRRRNAAVSWCRSIHDISSAALTSARGIFEASPGSQNIFFFAFKRRFVFVPVRGRSRRLWKERSQREDACRFSHTSEMNFTLSSSPRTRRRRSWPRLAGRSRDAGGPQADGGLNGTHASRNRCSRDCRNGEKKKRKLALALGWRVSLF